MVSEEIGKRFKYLFYSWVALIITFFILRYIFSSEPNGLLELAGGFFILLVGVTSGLIGIYYLSQVFWGDFP